MVHEAAGDDGRLVVAVVRCPASGPAPSPAPGAELALAGVVTGVQHGGQGLALADLSSGRHVGPRYVHLQHHHHLS